MKKLSLLFVFFLSTSLYAGESPTPFWYSISEKILAGTHQLLGTDDVGKSSTKVKTKVKIVSPKVPLKCQPKHEKKILPAPYFNINADGIWSNE